MNFYGSLTPVNIDYPSGTILYVDSWAKLGHREKICVKWVRRPYADVYQCTLNGVYLANDLLTEAEFVSKYPHLVR